MKKRTGRKRVYIVFAVLAAVALGILAALVVVRKSGIIPAYLNAYVNDNYLKDTGFTFSCGGLAGDLIGNAVLKNVAVTYRDGANEFKVFEARAIEADYSILDILKLEVMVQRLSLNGVRVHLRRDSRGALMLPPLARHRPNGSSGRTPRVVIEKYVFDNARFQYDDSTRIVRIADIKLSGQFRIQDGRGHFDIENGSARVPDTKTNLQSLRLSFDFSDSTMVLTDFIARLDRSYIMASGTYENGEARHLQFIFNPLDLQEISTLGLIATTGEVGGNLMVSGGIDTLHVRGLVTGKAAGLMFSGFSFSGSIAGGSARLSEVEGTVFGSYVQGMLTYSGGERGGYAFQGTCRGLDISEGFIPSSGVPRTDLYGSIGMTYRRFENRYSFSAALDSSSIEGFRPRHTTFEGQYTDARGLSINRLEFDNPGFKLSGSGTIDAKSVTDLIFSLTGDNFDYLWDYLKVPRVESSMNIKGKAAGPPDDLRINLNGSITNASFLFARLDSGIVQADIKNAASKEAAAMVDLQGKTIELAGTAFSSPHILLEAAGTTVQVKDFSVSKGDTLCTSDFGVTTLGEDQDILFRHLVIKMPAETWSLQSPVKLTVRAGTVAFDTAVLASRVGEIRLRGSYEEARGWIDIHAEGDDVEASLIQRSAGIPWPLQGKSRFSADWSGTVEEPAIKVDFTLGKGSLKGIGVDGVHFVCRYDKGGYRLDDLLVRSMEDSLRGTGAWQLAVPPLQLARESKRAELMFQAPWSFTIYCNTFPLEKVYRALNKKPILAGLYSGSITVGGSPANARFAARGTMYSTAENTIHFPDIALDAAYEDSLLDIHSISFDDGKFRGAIDGRLPVHFALTSGFRLRTEAPFELNVSISSRDISALATYLEAVDRSGGTFESLIHVHGTVGKPRFSGNIDFRDCTLHLADLEETYTKLNARITFLDNMAQMTFLDGRVGEKGRVHGTGSAELDAFRPKRYRVDLTLKDVLFASIHDFISLQDGTISVQSRGSGDNPLTPIVTGQLQVKQATITKSLGGEEGSQESLMMPSENPGWYCDLDIDAPKKIFVKNPGLHMELGGNVILKRDQSGMYLRGELSILRGSYTLYNNKFTITDGSFNFSAATSFRPEISVNAYNLYRIGNEEHRIFLNLSWPKDKKEPQVTLSSDSPQYSETDIWRMLGGTYIATGGTSSESGSFSAAGTAQNIATNYLEGVLNAQMSDLTIDVESRTRNGSSSAGRPEREMTIAIGKYLSEDLYLQFRQGLSIATEREIDIEYRIGTMVVLRSEIIRHSDVGLIGKSSQATDEVNFDIKLRFEY
jgi:hypothetical protein